MKAPDNKRIILIIIGVAVFLYVDCSFVIKTQLESVRTLKTKFTKLKEDMNSLDKNFADLNSVKKKQDQFGIKKRKIVSEEHIPTLLEDISNLANKNNIKIMQIKPSKETKAKEDKSAASTAFVPLTISLEVSCGYHNLGGYVNDLENANIFIALQEIKIRRDPNNSLEETANLVLKTYVKKYAK